MENNNWEDKARELAITWLDDIDEDSRNFDNCVQAILGGMQLVFEVTKKKSVENIEFYPGTFDINYNKVLNIKKPNL